MKAKTSHPSRVRGLKYAWIQVMNEEVESHPSRVRGLKSGGTKYNAYYSRVRGLKYDVRLTYLAA